MTSRVGKRVRFGALIVVLVGAGLAASSTLFGDQPWRPYYQAWASDSPWRRPLPGDVVIHPDSQRMIADLHAACGGDQSGPCKYPRLPGAADGDALGSPYGSPVYLVSKDTPTYDVECVKYPCGIQGETGEATRALFDVPIPRGARPDNSRDAHLVLYDPVRRLAWDLYAATYDPAADRWEARGGIRWDLSGPGTDLRTEPGGATAAGSPLMGTVVRPEEIRRALEDGTGVIPHVLSGGYSEARRDCWIEPFAKRTDGESERRWAIPEGAVLQLDPSIDVTKLGLSKAAEVIARTLQRYGMVIRDHSGAFSIEVENVSVEGAVDGGRPNLWRELELSKDSLRPISSEMFRVVAWQADQARGPSCP